MSKPEELWWCWECCKWDTYKHDRTRPPLRWWLRHKLAAPWYRLGGCVRKLAAAIAGDGDPCTAPEMPPAGWQWRGGTRAEREQR